VTQTPLGAPHAFIEEEVYSMLWRSIPRLMVLAFALLAAWPASAITITGATLIPAPPEIKRGALENSGILVFAEAQGFTLTSDLKLGKGGSVAAGTKVDVYYIIFDPQTLQKLTAKVNFGVEILGFARTSQTLKKTDFLGNPNTTYDPFQYRGLETGPGTSNRDHVKLSADKKELNFDIRTLSPGDVVRVIVRHDPVPEPGTILLLGLGLGGLSFASRRRRV
jgi:hypothetical protein